MKTIKIIAVAFTAILMVSCGTYYRMTTTLDRDGNATREIYALGDSAFMAGNMSHNPYLFDINSGWNITRFDTSTKYDFFGDEKSINVKVSRNVLSIDMFSKGVNCNKDNRSFAAPEETLIKKFRWFYTNYTFKGVYRQLSYDTPMPIDKYLSKEEQKLWAQGNFSSSGIMNGSEMKDMLDNIEGKFMDWYSRNCFEISLNSIGKLSGEDIDEVDKDKLYKRLSKQEQGADIIPEVVCRALDTFYKTTQFSELYTANEKTIDEEFEKAISVIDLIGNVISYELLVPGEVLSANSPIINSNTLIWKVDGMRILFDDYTLTAQYRVANLWAFILSSLILVTAIVSITLLHKRKRNI